MQNQNEKRFLELLASLKNYIKNFYKTGCALKEIRDQRLYKYSEHETFEKFCIHYLCISRSYAYRIINAVEVVENLSPIGDILINESQARALACLAPQEQKLAWNYATDLAAIEKRKVTCIDITNAVKQVKGLKVKDNKNKAKPMAYKNNLEKINVISPEFKKAYENLFEVINKAMNNEWKTTSKEVVISRLKALNKFIKNS